MRSSTSGIAALALTVELYENDSVSAETFRGRYRAFTVDEYQDVNALQQSLSTPDVRNSPDLSNFVRQEIAQFCVENCADERKKGETEEQFIYKTRKKALGPFKRRLWELDAVTRKGIVDPIEAKFEFLMEKLRVHDTRDVIERYVPVSAKDLPAYAAAGDEVSAMAVVDPNEGE